ncbi:MAG: pseudouridine synthase [bacterium]
MTSPSTDQQDVYIVPHCAEQPAIVYADDDVLLVSKPAMLLSVPGKHPLNKDCLITRLQTEWPTATIVHRLDLDTSGIMVVALNANAHRNLSRQFQERRVEKTYIAEVWGLVEKPEGEIALPLITDWPRRPRQMVCYENGKAALTRYRVIQTFPALNKTRVALQPVTGRSHQLRVHLKEIGHPILGCDLYAHGAALAMSPRLQLHAEKLAFTHPATGEPLEGCSRCPF